MKLNEITENIIDCAVKVHKTLGTGFLESVYQAAFAYELSKLNINFEKDKEMPLMYEEIRLETGFRCDFLIEKKVIVECKSVNDLTRRDDEQILNYLKMTGLHVGLLINFNTRNLSSGLKRIVNNFSGYNSQEV
jgi:GxxExxY protein